MDSYELPSDPTCGFVRHTISMCRDWVRAIVVGRAVGSILLGVLLAICILQSIGPRGDAQGLIDRSGLTQGTQSSEMSSEMTLTSTLPYTTYLPLVQRDHCPAASQVPSPFSISIAALHQIDESSPALLEALRESGAGWARVRIDWGMIQPDAPPPTDYEWGPYHDEKLRLVAETGVKLIAVVGDPPEWAAEERCAPIYPDRLGDFKQFLTDLVNRYKAPPYNIKHWELINEPDGTQSGLGDVGLGCWADEDTDEDGVRYAEMLKVASEAIKAADPEATVLMGGLAYDWFTEDEYGGPFDRYFLDDVMKAGGGAYVDVLNFHYFPDWHREWERWDPRSCSQHWEWLHPPTCGDVYDGAGQQYEAHGLDLTAKTTFFRNRMRTCFGVDKPVWVTELAEHGYSDDPDSLANQARYVIRGYVRGLAAGVENITWYALTTPNDGFQQSLLFDDWTPKPAFFAYQTLTSQLSGHTYSHDRSSWLSDDYDSCEEGIRGYHYVREAYVFGTPCGQEKTVAWSDEEEPGSLAFAPADQLRVVDREGEVTLIEDGGAGDADGVEDGSVELQLSPDPVFVTVRR